MNLDSLSLLAAGDLGDLFQVVIAVVVILGGLISGAIKNFRGQREVPVELDEDDETPARPVRSAPVRRQHPPERGSPTAPPPAPVATPQPSRRQASPTRGNRERRPAADRPTRSTRPAEADRQIRSEPVVRDRVPSTAPVGTLSNKSQTAAHATEAAQARDRFSFVRHPTRSTLRYALVMSEVLGPPLSVRPRDVDRT